ncbi:hypothetical protein DSECCO2_352770 [anaerobic digester metagenome]
MTDFSKRLAAVPPEIMEAARATTWPNAPLSEVLDTAEMLMRRLAGEKPSEDRQFFQPFLPARETRIIRDALAGHETVIEDDVAALRKLQGWFEGTLHG